MSEVLSQLALSVSGIVFAGLWEGAIIVAAVWLFLRALPRLGAATRYAVWLTALVMLAVAPITTVALSSGHPAAAAIAPLDTRSAAQSTASENARPISGARSGADRRSPQMSASAPAAQSKRIDIPLALSAALAALWLLFAGVRLLILAAHLCGLASLRKSAETLRVAFGYAVLASERTRVPLAIGFIRPAVVLPASLTAEVSDQALEAIVMHEVAHLRRCDVWTNAAARILEALLVLNPFAWFVQNRLSVEREIACDDWVVARLDAGEVFANTLADMVSRPAFAPIAAPSAIGSKHSVVARIERLMDRRPRRLRLHAGAITGVLLLMALFATIVPGFSPILALASPPAGHAAIAGCNHPALVERMDLHWRPTGQWDPLRSYPATAGSPPITVVDVTIDASGKLQKLHVRSSPHGRDARAAEWFFEHHHYRAAVKNCKAVASTVRVGVPIDIAPPAPISIVRADYPYGWSSRHPGACRIPDLLHGGVPNVRLVTSKPVTASVLVRVDANGSVTDATLTHSSGDASYDKATLAAARASKYPLGEADGFKPVRPSGAPLSWNASHGYSLYSKCTPLPGSYVWTTTFPARDS